jgi:hypothetical protein
MSTQGGAVDIVSTSMTVADYCNALHRREIVVNREYQRSDKVWPDIAKSFLIETLVLGYPMPKLSLHQVTDVRTRTTVKEIVDGQQRSTAILQFFDDELRLSGSLETGDIAGRRFSQLDDADQAKFLNYGLSVDLFVGVQPEEVREVFRRINSYTVPANPEEQRHASFQGEFKWFIYRLARQYDSAVVDMGLFTEKQIVRMNDTKLLAEIIHALLHGITTTNKRSLDALYRSRDAEFPETDQIRAQLEGALDMLMGLHEIHNTRLMKPYAAYALVLAMVHAHHPVGQLADDERPGGVGFQDRTQIVRNLSELLEALHAEDDERDAGPLTGFVRASSAMTNTAANRKTRFRWFYDALTQRTIY